MPPETRGPDAQLNAAGVWRKDKDKPSLRTRQGRAGQGSAQEKDGEGEDSSCLLYTSDAADDPRVV